MEPQHRPASRPSRAARRRLLWHVLLAALVVGGLCSGYLLYAAMRDINATADLPFLIAGPALADAPRATEPTSPPATPVPEPMNILLMGIDERDEAQGPSRTDTMILFSIDPASKGITMLSIPRDLWVPMPPTFTAVREDRINAAHFYGDHYHYAGGGPALAKETVQYNLGIPVQYYVRIDFAGFRRIIDEIGGIDIDVPRDIVDNAYPVGDGEVTTLHIKAGRQHMNGDLALKYARTRHDSNDIDRARRQQQVILAVRDKVLGLDVPLTRIPGLLAALSDSVQTDMSLDRMYVAAQAARQVGIDGIHQGVIDEQMTTRWITPAGADVLLPKWDQIRPYVRQLFSPSYSAVAQAPGALRDISPTTGPLP